MPELAGKLREIIEMTRRDIARGFDGVNLDALRAYAPRTKNSLRRALSGRGARFVMEVKRASPSAGNLSANADAADQALAYKGAADAISVLTEKRFFKGSLDDLSRVRAVYDGPILAKDFVLDPRQVVDARIHGADAILVILSVLDPHEARIIMEEASRFEMDVVVEVHDEAELAQAIMLGASIIGINNRNLTTFAVDLGTTERLAPLAPAGCILISESGIATREDVDRLSPHVDAFLIGSALMSNDNPAQKARELAFGRMKVCGLTSESDAHAAADCGASHAGFIFVPGTPRAMDWKAAEPIAAGMRGRGIFSVGVFRDADPNYVAEVSRLIGLDVIQLHGKEDCSYLAALRSRLRRPVEIWGASLVGVDAPLPRPGVDRTLFDTEVTGLSGGTGKTFEWERLGRGLIESAVLAGGLNAENVRAASSTGAWALDVCSGVEARPGIKDPAKMRAFADARRPATRGKVGPCS